MVEVASRELRNDTAGVLRKVESGETVVITRRGKAVADLVPHRSEEYRWLTPAEVMEIRKTADADPSWGSFLRRLDDESGDLDPIV
jgi:prevent-host-death family protein